MVTNGQTYRLLRNLGMLKDRTMRFNQADSMNLVRAKAMEVMRRQVKRNEKAYNLRSSEVSYEV